MTALIVDLKNNSRPSKEIRPAAPPADVAELRRPLAIGLTISGLIVVAIFVWGSIATLSGAVVANGMVVVDGSSKRIQPLQGGVIGEILVKDGSYVSAGDLLVKLDDTQARASLGIVTSQLTELLGRKVRLAAERDDRDDLNSARFTASDPGRACRQRRALFRARLIANGRKDNSASRSEAGRGDQRIDLPGAPRSPASCVDW
jgi:HlyD family secretion protein